MTWFERMFEYRHMAAVVSAPAQRARPGAAERSEGDRPLPVLPALEPLFATGGLRRGSAVAVRGSTSLLLALLAGPSGRGAWCGVVGLPGLGLVAAAEAGIALERLALVPDPGRDWAAVAAALLDAMEVVVVAPQGRVLDGDVRRLAARARQRGAVLVPYGAVSWPGAELRLSLASGVWEGLGDGSGHLRARRVLVRGEGRGSAARTRELALWLPAPDGGIRAADEPATPPLRAVPSLAPTPPAPDRPAPDVPHLRAVPDLLTPSRTVPDLPVPSRAVPDLPAPSRAVPDLPAPSRDATPTAPPTAAPATAPAPARVPVVSTPSIAALRQDATQRRPARSGPRAATPGRRGPGLRTVGPRPGPAGHPVPAGPTAPVGGGPPVSPPPPTAGTARRPAIPAAVLARLRPASSLPRPPKPARIAEG